MPLSHEAAVSLFDTLVGLGSDARLAAKLVPEHEPEQIVWTVSVPAPTSVEATTLLELGQAATEAGASVELGRDGTATSY